MTEIFLWSVGTFLVFLPAHVVVARCSGSFRVVRNSCVAFAIFLVVALLGFARLGMPSLVFAAAILISLWIIEMVALISAQNSVSLRILDEIERAPGQELTLEAIARRFAVVDSVKTRLELMKQNGLIASDGPGTVTLSGKALLAARFSLFVRRIFAAENPG